MKLLKYKCKPRYWEDSIVNGEYDTEQGDNIPCRQGDSWILEIDLDSGKILNWTQGVTAEIHYKAVDANGWSVYLDGKIQKDLSPKGDDLCVPEIMCPKSSGFGDYIIMDISESGYIIDWKPSLIDSLSK